MSHGSAVSFSFVGTQGAQAVSADTVFRRIRRYPAHLDQMRVSNDRGLFPISGLCATYC